MSSTYLVTHAVHFDLLKLTYKSHDLKSIRINRISNKFLPNNYLTIFIFCCEFRGNSAQKHVYTFCVYKERSSEEVSGGRTYLYMIILVYK